jgi:hypothetical protein
VLVKQAMKHVGDLRASGGIWLQSRMPPSMSFWHPASPAASCTMKVRTTAGNLLLPGRRGAGRRTPCLGGPREENPGVIRQNVMATGWWFLAILGA